MKDGVWQSWCVTKLVCERWACDRVGVGQSCVSEMVCESRCVTKLVCERWCVTKLVCERWCGIKLCE